MTTGLRESFGSVSLVRQGDHSFYSLTMPSDVLGKCCFVINREEDPILGFQRELDEKRASEIAQYIDTGLGTIPSSIVLSAQEAADLKYDSKAKSISFNIHQKAFLIIDGQHRVFGFIKANTAFRVPVVIYNKLSKRDETRLFIDINSKQKGVRPELLLDLKKLAEYESNQEEFLREIFDLFQSEMESLLIDHLSPSKKRKGKISRSVFNAALKPIVKAFSGKDSNEVFEILNSYLAAFYEAVFVPHSLEEKMFNATVFKAVCGFFPTAASKLKDRYGAIYTIDNFYSVLTYMADRIKVSKFEKPGNAHKQLLSYFEESMKSEFSL